jgi:hypothetical protein
MRRLASIAATIAVGLSGSAALADDGLESTETTVVVEPGMAPGKIEAGIYLGGFISNYFHQFYDPALEPMGVRELDRVNPEFGGRFAIFPNPNIGIEAEASVIMASTKMTGDGAQIYGLGAQAILQKPGRITPFVGLGIGLRATSSDDSVLGSDTDFPIHIGLGARFWLSKAVAIRFDARFLRGPSFPHDAATR